jgi:hypothetical protein
VVEIVQAYIRPIAPSGLPSTSPASCYPASGVRSPLRHTQPAYHLLRAALVDRHAHLTHPPGRTSARSALAAERCTSAGCFCCSGALLAVWWAGWVQGARKPTKQAAPALLQSPREPGRDRDPVVLIQVHEKGQELTPAPGVRLQAPATCGGGTVCGASGSDRCFDRTECVAVPRAASASRLPWDPDRFATYVSWGGAAGTAAGLVYAVVDVRRNYSGSFLAFPVFVLDTAMGLAAGLAGGAAVYGVHLLVQ